MTTVSLPQTLDSFIFTRLPSYHFFNHSVLAYIKGGVKERYNPLTGLRYERLQTHDANEPEDNPAASTSSNTTSKEHYSVAKRGRGGYFKKMEDRTEWRGRGRENSPYQRPNTESNKTAETSKGKDKQ